MIEPIILSLIVARIKGYKMKPLLRVWTLYPIFLYIFFYVFIETQIFAGNYYFVKYSSIAEKIYLITFIFPIIKYNLYKSASLGSLFIFIGTALNKVAIYENDGKMPVFPSLSYLTGYASHDAFSKVTDIHILGAASTKFKLLTDIIDVGYNVMSIGDIFIRLFSFLVIFSLIKQLQKTTKNSFYTYNAI